MDKGSFKNPLHKKDLSWNLAYLEPQSHYSYYHTLLSSPGSGWSTLLMWIITLGLEIREKKLYWDLCRKKGRAFGDTSWCMRISISKLLKHLIGVRSFSFPKVSHCPCQTWSCSTSARETTTEISLPSGRNFHVISLLFCLRQLIGPRSTWGIGPTKVSVRTLSSWLHSLELDFTMLPSRELQCFSHSKILNLGGSPV